MFLWQITQVEKVKMSNFAYGTYIHLFFQLDKDVSLSIVNGLPPNLLGKELIMHG